jgi:hypothetical protein
VVNDLGAVQYFGVNSLTAVIYSTWINPLELRRRRATGGDDSC